MKSANKEILIYLGLAFILLIMVALLTVTQSGIWLVIIDVVIFVVGFMIGWRIMG